MSEQANAKLIGFFVIGAVALLLFTVVLLSSARLFSERQKFVLHFSGSVNGLTVGSPVKFRGVRVGTVTDIVVAINPQDETIDVPVFIQLDSHRVSFANEKHEDVDLFIEQLIDRGLRAQLQMESLVTGQLYIEFDFKPATPVELVADNSGIPQIPTIPSGADALGNAFEALRNAMNGVEDFLTSAQVKEVLASVTQAMQSSNNMVIKFNEQVIPVSSQLTSTLTEFTEAMNAIKVLADYLERHPESLIMGKRRN